MGGKLRGSVTVFASIVFPVVLSLLVVMIDSAASQGAVTQSNRISNLSVQSLFSHYSRPLLDNYEIFAGVYKDKASMELLMYDYMEKNLDYSKKTGFNPYMLNLQEINIENIDMLTDENGKYFYDQIVEYMKLGVLDSTITEYVDKLNITAKSESANVASEIVEERKLEAAKIDAMILDLITIVEGIRTTDTNIYTFWGRKYCNRSFGKRIIANSTSDVGIDNESILSVTRGNYYALSEELNNLKGDLDFIKFIYYHPLTAGIFNDYGFKSRAMEINNAVGESIEMFNNALVKINQIKNSINDLLKKVDTSIESINQLGDMDENIRTYHLSELQELKGYKDGSMHPVCNLDNIYTQIESNKNQLIALSGSISGLSSVYMDIYSIDSVYGMVDGCINQANGYSVSNIRFDYTGFCDGEQKLSYIKNIKKNITRRMTSGIMEEMDISNKSVAIRDLSSDKLNYKSNIEHNLTSEFLYNRYISRWFSAYDEPNKDGLLEYDMEYILSGERSDRENIEAAINKLLAIRFAVALAYIVTDTAKKQECLGLATTLLGFCGTYGIIKTGQYLLLTSWAYTEACNDVRLLVNGNKVPFEKNNTTFVTTLQDVLAYSQTKPINKGGLSYRQYLELLLYIQSVGTRIENTMSCIELNMIAKGYEHIRMYNYFYGIKGYVTYSYRKKKQTTSEFNYSYK